MTLTLDHIETIPVELPLASPLRWGTHSVLHSLRHVLVRVTLSDGSQGVAEIPPRPTIYGETAATVVSLIAEELGPRLLHRPLGDYLSRLYEIKNNHTAKGGLDRAIQAALAASRGTTLASHLGCTRSRIKVSYILGIGETAAMVAEAAGVYADGVRVLKVKVGRDWSADLERLRTLQQELPADLSLYVDANECFTPQNAPERLAQLADLGILYCEEPLPIEQLAARRELRAAGHLPLVGDDSCFTPRDLARELESDSFDILNIKPARTGFSQSKQMITTATAQGKGIMIGSQASAGLGTARAALVAALPEVEHPSELSFFLKVTEDVVTQPLQIVAGYLDVAACDQIEVDWEKVARKRIDA